jgi:hypothetical protein
VKLAELCLACLQSFTAWQHERHNAAYSGGETTERCFRSIFYCLDGNWFEPDTIVTCDSDGVQGWGRGKASNQPWSTQVWISVSSYGCRAPITKECCLQPVLWFGVAGLLLLLPPHITGFSSRQPGACWMLSRT